MALPSCIHFAEEMFSSACQGMHVATCVHLTGDITTES